MYEKRNKRLLIVFATLVVAIVVAFAFTRQDSGFAVRKDLYRHANLREIDQVTMRSPAGEVNLQYTENRWRVNGRFAADRNLVEVLFATLQQAEAKRPVARSMADSIAMYLKSNGVLVSLQNDGQPELEFYAGGNAGKTVAYFIGKDASTPHVAVIPGYRVYVSGIFELPAIQWREKLIFDFNWTNFRQLEAEFRNPQGNFTVELYKNVASIKGIVDPDTARLNTFLDDLSLLTVDEYLETTVSLDSLSKSEPHASFTITDIGGRAFKLRVYTLDNQFIGVIGDDVFASLSRDRIVPLLRPKEFFLKR